MADLGKAYVQIIPKAEGITGKINSIISPASSKAGKDAGEKAGGNFGGALKKTLAGLAIGATVVKGFQSALDEGAKLQQSYGGLETIYGDAAEAAKEYASQAAQAGISANSYAEQAVSFGASLKQAFAGDSAKAVEAANTAILDMADNAAKMGTPLESIQNAYQGFAKQNYTMLDNLKLGYGGTKSEMERLLADAQEISGVEYNIDNLGDVYDAIHVVQGELGLTGVAAAEASETFSGSFEAMKAAAANLLGNLALGENVEGSMKTLINSVGTFLGGNLIPAVTNVMKSLPGAIGAGITTALPMIIDTGKSLVNNLVSGVTTTLPDIISSGEEMVTSLASGVLDNLPALLDGGNELLDSLMNGFTEYFPVIMDKGGELIGQLLDGIGAAVPQIATVASDAIAKFGDCIAANLPMIGAKGGELIAKFGDCIAANLPMIGAKGGELIAKLASGIIRNLPSIVASAGKITAAIIKAIVKIVPQMLKAGMNMAKSIASGLGGSALGQIKNAINNIKNALTKPIDTAKSTISNTLNGIKRMFPLSIGKVFSGLKFPHFTVTGGVAPYGIGGKGSLPKFSISGWYAKGAVFDSPTIVGVGEAGREAVIPLSGQNMRPFAKAIGEEMGGMGTSNTFNFYVSGAENPEDWASRTMRQLKMEVRMA